MSLWSVNPRLRRVYVGLMIGLAALAVLDPPAAKAEWRPRVEARVVTGGAGDAPGELLVNGVVVLRLRAGAGGLLPVQRAEVAAERLRTAVGAGLEPSGVLADTDTDRLNPRLKALGQVLATAGKEDAQGSGMSPAALARSWAAALRKALAIPGLSVSTDGLLVPLNETRTLRLSGAARGPVTITSASGGASIVAATEDPATGAITLRGAAPGRETLTLTREEASATVSVAVQPYAGRIEAARPLAVTGTSVPAEMIARHALATALTAARPIPGAAVRVTAPTLKVAPLDPGARQTVEVPLEITGPDMIPVRNVVAVRVEGRTLAPVNTTTLLYSNNPERVTRFGTLFTGRLSAGAGATRLLYHHQSAMDRAAWFTVELINDGSTPATVQVVGGAAGPVLDTVWVGYRAASLFLKSMLGDVGAFVEVPANSRVALTSQRLAPGLTISGLSQLRQVAGSPLLVRVAADIPGDAQTVRAELMPTPLLQTTQTAPPPAASLSEHVYPDPQKALKAEYQVGGRWTFLSIGRVPIKTAVTERNLEGNYGVFYNIALTLENPTDRPATAQIVFEPSAGLAGGIFLIDGRSVEIPQTNLPNETILARYDLPPGAKQTVQMRTLPLSGSNYPARLIVRPGPTPVAASPAVVPASLPAAVGAANGAAPGAPPAAPAAAPQR